MDFSIFIANHLKGIFNRVVVLSGDLEKVLVDGDNDKIPLSLHCNSVVSFISLDNRSSPLSNHMVTNGIQMYGAGLVNTVSFVVRIQSFSKISSPAKKDSIFVSLNSTPDPVE